MKVQEMENLSIAFKFMLEKEEIPLVNIGMTCATVCIFEGLVFV